MRTKHWRRGKWPPQWQIQAVKKLKRISYITCILSPHLLLERAQTQNGIRNHFWGPTTFFLMAPQMGCTFWISFWRLQWFFSRNVCRICEQLCQIDHSDSIAWMPSRGSLVYVFATGHSLDALLTYLPGLGRCSSRQQNPHRTFPQIQPNWRWGSQGLVAAAGGVWRTIEIQWILLL